MKKVLAIAMAALSLASFAKTERLVTATVADMETLATQAGKLGMHYGNPMIGMMLAQSLQANPVTEKFGPSRPGELTTAYLYGDAEKLDAEDKADAFEKTLALVVVYPSTKTKAELIADNTDAVETNGVVKLRFEEKDVYAAFSADGKWLVVSTDADRAKRELATAGKNKAKVAYGAAFDVRVTEAGVGFLKKCASQILPKANPDMSAADSAEMDHLASVLSQTKKLLFAMRVSDNGVDMLGSVTPVAGSELAKCGAKPFSKADPLAFAGKESLFALAAAPDCGSEMEAGGIERVLAFLKSKGFKTEFIKVVRKGAECKVSFDVKNLAKYMQSSEAEQAIEGLGDLNVFNEELKKAFSTQSDGKFKAASPETMISVSVDGTVLPSTASQRFAKAFPDLKGKKPYSVFTCSLYATVLSVVNSAIADDPSAAGFTQILAALPKPGDGSISMAQWKEKDGFKAILRITPDELKNIVTLGTMALAGMTPQGPMFGPPTQLPPSGDDAWEGDDDDASTAK